MASLSLPPPRNLPSQSPSIKQSNPSVDRGGTNLKADNTVAAKKPSEPHRQPPSYAERCRAAASLTSLAPEERKKVKLFVPRSTQDFGDGGAFPEIHVAQYPRHMGNPHVQRNGKAVTSTNARGAQVKSRALVQVQVDEKGEVSYDAIVKGGTNADRIVYSKHSDLKGGTAAAQDISLPTAEEEAAQAAKTQAALDAILGKKTAMAKPTGSAIQQADTSRNVEEKTNFITYTPRPDAPGYNPAAAKRVIQMVPAQVDPMAPPKHKHIKAPAGPAEDLVPVLHKPAQKLTKEERDAWNVPACISNWKNTRGYVIPLDKRLAADGRGLQDHSINTNFATLSESLYVAERQARQEVKLRAQVQKKLALQEKEARESELRDLAQEARMQRSGIAAASGEHGGVSDADSSDEEASNSGAPTPSRRVQDDDDEVAARQRDKLRQERKRERERQLRQEQNVELKKQKFEEERDVSEKIALGVHTGGGALGGEMDSRLYNQSAGMDSGFGREDEYNTYSKPLFERQAASSSIYRPTRGDTSENADEQYSKLVQGATSKFQPSKGFAGAEADRGTSTSRSAPVQFEKER